MDEPFCDGGSLASSCGGNSAVAKFVEYPRDAADVVARVDADFTLPTNATQLPVGIWFSIVVEEDGSYASQLGYADEKTASHVASARSRSGRDESSVVVFAARAFSTAPVVRARFIQNSEMTSRLVVTRRRHVRRERRVRAPAPARARS